MQGLAGAAYLQTNCPRLRSTSALDVKAAPVELQWQRSVCTGLELVEPRPQHMSSQPPMPSDVLLHSALRAQPGPCSLRTQ